MSTVITIGAVVLIAAFFVLFLFSRWRLRTIGLALGGVALVYVGGAVWFSNAVEAALERRPGPQQVDQVPHKVVESDAFQVVTNESGRGIER